MRLVSLPSVLGVEPAVAAADGAESCRPSSGPGWPPPLITVFAAGQLTVTAAVVAALIGVLLVTWTIVASSRRDRSRLHLAGADRVGAEVVRVSDWSATSEEATELAARSPAVSESGATSGEATAFSAISESRVGPSVGGESSAARD